MKKGRIGIFIGNTIAPNMEAFLYNIGKMLSNHFKLDIIVGEEPNEKIRCFYDFIYYLSRTNYNDSLRDYFCRFINYFKDLTDYMEDKDPDILFQVTHYPIHAPVVSIAGKVKNKIVVLRLAGDDFNEYRLELSLLKKVRHFIRCNVIGIYPLLLADKVIALNTHGMTQLIKHGCKKHKIEIIPQPIDTSRFKRPKDKFLIREKLGLPLDKRIILYVGRLSWLKGMETFLRVIPKVYEKDKDIIFLLIGKGEYFEKLKRFKNVYIISEVPHYQIHEYYQASDLLVHPSLIEVGINNTILEAIACGVPVIARNLPGIKEFGITTFNSDSELLELILNENTWKIVKLPPEYEWDILERKYVNLFSRLIELKS